MIYSELLDDAIEIVSLIEITFAGRSFFWASRAVTLESTELGAVQYEGGLDIDWRDALALFNERPPLVSVAVDVFFPSDVAELVAKGHDLGRATGELALWAYNDKKTQPTYEQRVVLFSGSV